MFFLPKNPLQGFSQFWQRLTRNQKFALVSLLILLLALPAGVFLAQQTQIFKPKASETSRAQAINNLTDQLLQINRKYSRPGIASTDKETQLNTMVSIASLRKEQLLREVEENPEAFLDHAQLTQQRESFPKEVQNYLEEGRETDGTLVVTHIDDFDRNQSSLVYNLKTTDKIYTLHFAKNPPDLRVASNVRVKGIVLDSEFVLKTGDNSTDEFNLQSTGVVAISPIGEQRTIVMLLNFEDDTGEPISVNDVRNLMFGDGSSVDKFYRESSFNQTSFFGDVVGYYTVPYSSEVCSPLNWMDAADSIARNSGVDLNTYPRRVYVTPAARSCPYGGSAGSYPDFSVARIIATSMYVFTHELGHNLGTAHANAQVCNPKVPKNQASRCSETEYADPSDVMGHRLAHFNAPHKIEVGWVADGKIQTVTTNGIYTVYALEDSTPNVQALRILKKSEQSKDGRITNIYYYLSFRRPVGFDSDLPEGITRGLNIHFARSLPNSPTVLVDSTPESVDGAYDAALSDGASFYDPERGIEFRQISHDENSVTVEVKFDVSSPTPTPQATQNFTIAQGWNLVGLTIDKGTNYKAEDLLKDLNASFVPRNVPNKTPPLGNKILSIYRFDPSRGRFISHTIGRTDDTNFAVVPGEGYFVQSTWPGTATMSGAASTLSSLTISRGLSIISFPTVPTGLANAESVLQAMKNQGVDVRQITRWFGGTYRVYGPGTVSFPITPGEGYFIRNFGSAGTFTLP